MDMVNEGNLWAKVENDSENIKQAEDKIYRLKNKNKIGKGS